MTYMNEHFAMRALAAACMLLAACDRAPERASVADSLLARDLTLAASASVTRAAPLLGDTARLAEPPVSRPVAAEPLRASRPGTQPVARSAPRPAPPAPAPAVDAPVPQPSVVPTPEPLAAAAGTGIAPLREIGFGTVIAGQSTGTICALANRPGDRLVIKTTADAFGSNGARLPAGSQIVVEMTQPEAGAEFSFRAISVQVDSALLPVFGTVRIDGTPTERRVSTGNDKSSVLGNAVKGAILGRILGGGAKGAIIGAAGGVAVGTATARRNSVAERCLPSGLAVSVVLSAPLILGSGAP